MISKGGRAQLKLESAVGSGSIDDLECKTSGCQDLFDEPNLNEISFFSYCAPP